MPVPRPQSRFHLRDILVILVCSAGTILFLALFWLDLNRSLSRQNEAPIGTVTWKYKAAQRRFVDRMLWDRLRRESLVYNGDYIRTAELSEALIGFFSGGEISLNENSLVQIFSAVGGLEVAVSEGEITAAAGNGMVISSGDRRLVLERGSTANAGAGADGAFNVAITRGNATLRREGRSEELGPGRVRSFDNTGREQNTRQSVVLSPPPNARIFASRAGEAIPVTFTFNKENYSGQTRLEIAEDRSFTRLVFSDISDTDRFTTSLSETGAYYWRVYPASSGADAAPGGNSGENSVEARAFRLTVEYNPAPVLVNPTEGQIIRYRNNAQIRFQWNLPGTSERPAPSGRQETPARQGAGGQAGPVHYILELADNPGMANPAVNIQTGNQSLTTTLPGPGRWYWRVTPVYPSSGSPAAAAPVSSFTLEQGAELSAPVLNLPAEGSVINPPREKESIVFSWRRENDAASYTIQIARGHDLANPLVSRTVRNSYVNLESGVLDEGDYFWGVFQSDNSGNASALSSVRSFSVREGEAAPRTRRPPETQPLTAPERTAFSDRRPVLQPDDSRQERTRTVPEPSQRPAALREPPAEQPAVLSEPPVEPPAALPEPPIEQPAALREPPAEPPDELPVEQQSLLFPGPENRQPSANTVIGPEELRSSRNIAFEWDSVDGANGYIFSLYRVTGDNERSLVLQTGPLAETGYTLTDLSVLERGIFIWETEAVSETSGGIIEKRGIKEEYRLTIDIPPLQRNTQGEAGVLYGR